MRRLAPALAGLVLLLACLAVAGPAAAAGVPEATAIRASTSGQRTRVVLELDRPVPFRSFTIPNPLRLVVDLPEVEWRIGPRSSLRPAGLVTGERHGLFSRGRSRLVLDMAAPFRVVEQRVLPPAPGSHAHRLVIELEPIGRLPPTAGRPQTAMAAAPRAAVAAASPVVRAAPARLPPAVPLPRPRDLPPPPEALPPMLSQAEPTPTAQPPRPLPLPAVIIATELPAVEPAAAPAPAAVEAPPALEPEPEPEMEVAVLVPPAAPPEPVPLPPVLPAPELPVIVIDPGHGGVDPGAVGKNGLHEKTVVLEVALVLRELLEASGRYRAVLTRTDDTFLRLRERIAAAREAGGDLFISLHADSLSASTQRGAAVYTLSETASDEEAGRLASKENKSDILAGTDLSHHDEVVTSILIDLAQRETNNRSIAFADLLAEELGRISPLVHRHRRFAGFAVLKSPDMPSVLVELGYLSNPEDAHNLSQPEYRASLAAAVLKALDRQFARTGL